MDFWQTLQKRRTHYDLAGDASLSREAVETRLAEILQATPSAFNTQSARVVLLWAAESQAFWQQVNQALGERLDPRKYAGFQAAQGTLLYFLHRPTVAQLETTYPQYRDGFYTWAQHENAMLQNNVWMGLTAMGLAASLQHYGAVLGDTLHALYDLDPAWELVAQMPFGRPVGTLETLPKLPIETQLIIRG